MAGKHVLPHDRGHLLWTAEDGASRLLLGSMDRWINAILADDCIDSPMYGVGDEVTAKIIARDNGIIVGTAMIDHLIQIWAPSIQISWKASDGKHVSENEEIAILTGCAKTILKIERSILNILGQLSGIATETKKWSSIAVKQIACTRKTTWGLLDKWAVHLGGGLTHRLNRDDALMIKENDLAAYQDDGENSEKIAKMVQKISIEEVNSFFIIEVRTDKEALTVAAIWQQKFPESEIKPVIMLDNFGPEKSNDVAKQLDQMGLRNSVILEGSGNITLDNLEEWFECGLDVLSTSSINRGVKPLDVSMIIGD